MDPEIIRWTGMIMVLAFAPPLFTYGVLGLFRFFRLVIDARHPVLRNE